MPGAFSKPGLSHVRSSTSCAKSNTHKICAKILLTFNRSWAVPCSCKPEFLLPLMRKDRRCVLCQDGAEVRVLSWRVDCYSCLQKVREEKANNSEAFFQRKPFLNTIAPACCLGPTQARRVLRVPCGCLARAADSRAAPWASAGTREFRRRCRTGLSRGM